MPPPKRECIPDYDKEGLKKAMKEYVRSRGCEKAFQLGPYEKLSRNKACNGAGIVQLATLLGVILDHCPHAEMHISYAKDLLLWLQSDFTSLSGSMSPGLWASWMTERLLTILCHLRRIHSSAIRLSECCSRLTQDQKAILQELLSKIKKPGAGRQNASPPGPSKSAPISPKKRRLREQLSEVTVDSDGFPMLLQAAALPDDDEKDDQSRGLASHSSEKPAKAMKAMKSMKATTGRRMMKGRPAGNFGKMQKKPASYYYTLSRDQRAKLRPGGCAKCRWSVCSPSCFLK